MGKVVLLPLEDVRPNPWNPNKMTDHLRASLEHGLRTDGWLASQALLIWATDEKGVERKLIIDGEHRWAAGIAVGLARAPMVLLDGLTEAEAKQLTIKMNQKRGDWDQDELARLVRSLGEIPDAPLELGFDPLSLEAILGPLGSSEVELQPESPPRATPIGERVVEPDFGPREVVIHVPAGEYAEFTDKIRAIGETKKTATVSETLVALVRDA